MFKHVSELKVIRDALSLEIERMEQETVKPTAKQRVISRSAQSVEPGMLVDFPWGWQYCNGISRTVPNCVLSSTSGQLWSCHVKDRVRTKSGLK